MISIGSCSEDIDSFFSSWRISSALIIRGLFGPIILSEISECNLWKLLWRSELSNELELHLDREDKELILNELSDLL